MSDNPFILEPYLSQEYFCDREAETEQIITLLENGSDITLISPRRLGKTGLILHVFDCLAKAGRDYKMLYADISASSSIEDFISILSGSIVGALSTRQKISRFFSHLGAVRPLVSYDPITGAPQVSFFYASENEKKTTLKQLLDYLENCGQTVILAIDEFQQIREYEGVNMEAVLRSHIQHLHNVRFIFCGSKKHIMADMFANAKRPFYESTSTVPLLKLSRNVYAAFIEKLFALGEKRVAPEALDFIMDWTRTHTFYTQKLCNQVYAYSGSTVTLADVRKAACDILASNLYNFLEIKRLVTPSQWKVLRAIAKEGEVCHPTSSYFTQKYKIQGPSVLRALDSLVDKELVLSEVSDERVSYSVYNVFFSRYLETL